MVITYEIWLLTKDGYRRIIVDTPEEGNKILKSIKVYDDWID